MHEVCAAYAELATRAKISNSLYALPDGVDGRSAVARRFRDVVRETLKAVGIPEAELNPVTREQIRTVGLLQIRLEALQARALTGEIGAKSELAIVRLANSLARLRWVLGIGRRRRQELGTNDLDSYIASKGPTP
jgi:hypothetical protein